MAKKFPKLMSDIEPQMELNGFGREERKDHFLKKVKEDFKNSSSSRRMMQFTEIKNRKGRTGLLRLGGGSEIEIAGFGFDLLNLTPRQG